MATARYDFAIAGMGPVGLAAAFEAAKKGNRVLLIEKRSEENALVRPQFLMLDLAGKNQLLNMISKNETLEKSDLKFIDALISSGVVKVSQIQKFILNRINNLNKANSDNPPIHFKYETTVDHVDFNSGNLSLRNTKDGSLSESVTFSNLVAADGARSETLDRVNTYLSESKQSEKTVNRTTPNNMRHLEKGYHMGAYVNIRRRDGKELTIAHQEANAAFLANHESGNSATSHLLYVLRFDKKSHIDANKKSVKLGFIGEVPRGGLDQIDSEISVINTREKSDAQREQLKQKQDEKKVYALNYVKKAAANFLQINEDELIVEFVQGKKPGNELKDHLKLQTFAGGSKRADKSAMEINGRGFYLIGDAYFTPYYIIKHGLNNGLESSRLLSQLNTATNPDGEEQASHINSYNELSSKNANYVQTTTGRIKVLRKIGVLRSKFSDKVDKDEDKIDDEPMPILRHHKNAFAAIHKEFLLPANRGSDEKLKISLKNLEFLLLKCPALVNEQRDNIFLYLDIAKQRLEAIQMRIKNAAKPYSDTMLGIIKFHHDYTLLLDRLTNRCHYLFNKMDNDLIARAMNNPSKVDARGNSPLQNALSYGSIEAINSILKIMKSKGVKIDKVINYEMMLNNSRTTQNSLIISMLVENGVNPFLKSSAFNNVLEGENPVTLKVNDSLLLRCFANNNLAAFFNCLTAASNDSNLLNSAKKYLSHDTAAYFKHYITQVYEHIAEYDAAQLKSLKSILPDTAFNDLPQSLIEHTNQAFESIMTTPKIAASPTANSNSTTALTPQNTNPHLSATPETLFGIRRQTDQNPLNPLSKASTKDDTKKPTPH